MLKRALYLPLFLAIVATLTLSGCSMSPGGGDSGSPPTPASTNPSTVVSSMPTLTAVPTVASLHLNSVVTTVSPPSFGAFHCGQHANFTFTSTITIAAGGGGPVVFTWTVGSVHSPGSVIFAPGETSKSVSYTLSNVNIELGSSSLVRGSLSAVAAGSTLSSSPVSPAGNCVIDPPTGDFHVTSVHLAVSPTSIAGRACNTPLTLTYTVTFHMPTGSIGGPLHFSWTANNGRSQTDVVVTVLPGQTVKTYTYTVSGTLYPDNTFPGNGIVLVTSPDNLTSNSAHPSGTCS